MSSAARYCGRDFIVSEIETIHRLIEENPQASRAHLSRMVCEELEWVQANGRLKDMSCRVAMIRMQDDGLIRLPPPLTKNGNGQRYRRRTAQAEPELQMVTPAGELADLHLELVAGHNRSHLWNEYIDRYHYLTYTPLPGSQLRYFAKANGRILALFGFGAAAWKTAPRDGFIGWTAQQRERNLHLVVNNARFLILPWVRSRHLASRLLGMASGQIAEDWQKSYSYRPVLLETFVEIPRFKGTSYKAANWIHVGRTKGRGKLDRYNRAQLPHKDIWLHPLNKNFRRTLCS
jgi:hypothetical protein